MKSYICLTFFLLVTYSVLGSPDIKIYYEQTPNGYSVFANNKEFCRVSVKLMLDLTNLRSVNGNNKVFVIPAQSEKIKLTDLVVINSRKAYGYKSNTIYNYGNHNQREYDINFSYQLPFKTGESYLVGQGYNGSTTHQNKNALDFEMSIGTEIHAARGGIVISVVENNNQGCAREECKKYNNFIIIQHEDGTFAEYVHLKQNGVIVAPGDLVIAGQHIGYSGNTVGHLGHIYIFKCIFKK